MEFRILGPLEVKDEGQVLKLGGAKQRGLLTLLLLRANEAVSRDRLIDELWGDQPPETASTAIQVHISQLRKVLGRDVIVTQTPGYAVRLEAGQLDLARFEEAVAGARGAAPAEAADRLREALGLWRGVPLAELDGPFATAERGRLEEQRLAAVEQRIAADLELGRQAELVPELERLVSEHPLREQLRGQLMLALYRCGRQAEALDVYRVGRRLLDEELGLEPGEELRRLERAILEQNASLAAPAAAAAAAKAPVGDRAQELDEAAAPAEERRLRLVRRSRVAAVVGALLLLAAAIAGVALALTRDSGGGSVELLPNSVGVIDTDGGELVGTVPIGGRPLGLAVGEGGVWAANADDGTLVRIDPDSNEIAEVIGLGADVGGVAVGFGSVWVAGGNDETLFRVDPGRNDVEAELEVGVADPLRPKPVFLVAAGDTAVWVTRGNMLLGFDPASQTVTKRVALPGTPYDLGVGDGNVWVTLEDERLLRIEEESANLTAAPFLPYLAISPIVVEGALWVIMNTDVPQVARFDAESVTQTASVPFPKAFLVALAADDGVVYAIDNTSGRVWSIDTTTLSASPVLAVPHTPESITAAGGKAWVGIHPPLT